MPIGTVLPQPEPQARPDPGPGFLTSIKSIQKEGVSRDRSMKWVSALGSWPGIRSRHPRLKISFKLFIKFYGLRAYWILSPQSSHITISVYLKSSLVNGSASPGSPQPAQIIFEPSFHAIKSSNFMIPILYSFLLPVVIYKKPARDLPALTCEKLPSKSV